MKAKYILAALEAMARTEKLLADYDATMPARYAMLDDLQTARIDLKVRSGLMDVEIEVEK